jgi:hypothetical protein
MTSETLLLSRSKLQTFLDCPRRFQLRYLKRLPWPDAPDDPQAAETMTRGQQFHLLLERHFLGLDIPLSSVGDTAVSAWFQTFIQHNPVRQNGRFLPEHRLTVPIGNHLLLGRFDLLVIGEQNGAPFAHVYDWKTGQPRSERALRQDWQTRLYLALLAEGGGALWSGRALLPENVALTYWYVTEPDAPRHFTYSQAEHRQNWADIQAIVAQIDACLTAETWPLTGDLAQCRRCAYQVYCGRQEAGLGSNRPFEETEPDEIDFLLEPDLL